MNLSAYREASRPKKSPWERQRETSRQKQNHQQKGKERPAGQEKIHLYIGILYIWWGWRGNLTLITLGSERVNVWLNLYWKWYIYASAVDDQTKQRLQPGAWRVAHGSPAGDYLAFADGLECKGFFNFGEDRDGDWLDLFMWPFRDILGRLTRSTAHCHRRREQNVFACAFIASVALLSQIWTARIACERTRDYGELFLEQFWLRWFSPWCT